MTKIVSQADTIRYIGGQQRCRGCRDERDSYSTSHHTPVMFRNQPRLFSSASSSSSFVLVAAPCASLPHADDRLPCAASRAGFSLAPAQVEAKMAVPRGDGEQVVRYA
jgi:hypothetical protein